MGNALSCCQDLGRVSWEERQAEPGGRQQPPGQAPGTAPLRPLLRTLGGFVPHPSLSRKPGVPGRGELQPPCGHRARPRALSPAGEPSQGTASGRSASHRAPATLHGLSPAAADWSKGDSWPRGASPPSRQLQSLE